MSSLLGGYPKNGTHRHNNAEKKALCAVSVLFANSVCELPESGFREKFRVITDAPGVREGDPAGYDD
jgi:hypothetical protein